MSVDAQWRRKNIKTGAIMLLVAVIVIGAVAWFRQTIDDRQRERCRDAGGTPITVRHWETMTSSGEPQWRHTIECRGV
jgi:hypothetical protein